MKSEIITL